MLFNSFQFLLFFPTVTFLYFLLPHRFRWQLLLFASCVFYMAFIPAYIAILGVTILIDYFAALWISTPGISLRRNGCHHDCPHGSYVWKHQSECNREQGANGERNDTPNKQTPAPLIGNQDPPVVVSPTISRLNTIGTSVPVDGTPSVRGLAIDTPTI